MVRRYLNPVVSPASLPGDLAVCTAYYNPWKWQTRKLNFDWFATAVLNQGVDLWVSTSESSETFPEIAGVHILRFEAGDAIWQKERLLNLLIYQLPERYDKIAWTDCDLLYDSPNWVQDTANMLQQYKVGQCFSEAVWLNRMSIPEKWFVDSDSVYIQSIARRIEARQGVSFEKAHPGFCWAARREVLEEIGGLYDYHIIGSGDTVMTFGFYGIEDRPFFGRIAGGAYQAVAEPWAKRAHRVVDRSVGCVPGRIRHLWHGDRSGRKYTQRIVELAELGFEPKCHLIENEAGLWKWSPTTPEAIKDYVQTYFENRKEDPLTPALKQT